MGKLTLTHLFMKKIVISHN